MARVLISGYYGFGNLGDEVILKTIITALTSCGEGVELKVLSADTESTSAVFGVEAVPRWNFWSVLPGILWCNYFILGGGGLIQDRTGSVTAYYYLILSLAALVFGKKLIIYAQGFGPVKSVVVKRLCGYIYRRAKVITMRDKGSAVLLSSTGVGIDKIVVTADPVWAYECEPKPSAGQVNRGKGKYFCVIPRAELTHEEIVSIAEAVDGLSIEYGFNEAVILPFQPLCDTAVSEELARYIKKVRPVVADGYQKFGDALNIISGAAGVITMRMHGVVFSLKAGVPVVGFGNDNKIGTAIIDGGACPRAWVRRIEVKQLGARLKEVMVSWNAEDSVRTDKIAEIQRLAKQNSEILIKEVCK